jgi:hypothetical protein
MFMYSLDPPVDDYEKVQDLVEQACQEFLKLAYKSGRFENLYDLMFEEIRENLIDYLPQEECYQE